MLGLSFSLLNNERIKYLSQPFKVPQTVNQRPMSSFEIFEIYNGSIKFMTFNFFNQFYGFEHVDYIFFISSWLSQYI